MREAPFSSYDKAKEADTRNVQQGRFFNTSRVLQIVAERDRPAIPYCDDDERVHAQLVREEPTILSPPEVATQTIRIFVPDQINSAAPVGGRGRLYQFLAEISMLFQKFEGCRASIAARLTAWPPGARRRESRMPKLLLRLGDLFEMITVHSRRYDQLHGGSWLPANGRRWLTTKPYTHWDMAGFGVRIHNRAAPPRIGATNLQPRFPTGKY